MSDFRGVFPAIITPMTPDGELNEAAFREVMEFDIQSGVHGFWIAGGTGESIFLTDEENNRIAEISVDQNAGRVKNIMHVGASTTVRAAKMAEHAARAGVEAICCVPPFFYQTSDEAIVEHYRVVGAASDLPLFVYNLPQCTGVEITPELIGMIQDRVPQLRGLKHSSLDFAKVADYNALGLNCLTGSSLLMLPGLTIGSSGCVDGPPCAAPELWVEIWNAYQDGDMQRAEVAQKRASAVLPLLRKHGYHASVKAMVGDRLGIECGDPRPPLPALTPEQRVQLREDAAKLGLGRV
jgi:dihydrodipicolinate synthase/N-acetylneuraminate lyase